MRCEKKKKLIFSVMKIIMFYHSKRMSGKNIQNPLEEKLKIFIYDFIIFCGFHKKYI